MTQKASPTEQPTAHVVGSINRDIVAYAPRLPLPGETVLGTHGALFPGGKGANQAVAIARLGTPCRLIGNVGADGFGSEMITFLQHEGVDTSAIVMLKDAATGFALITVDAASENCITVVPGANMCWSPGRPELQAQRGDIVLAQLEVPLDVVTAAFQLARAAGAATVLNPAPYQALPEALLAVTDTVILNETELAALAGVAGAIDTNNEAAVSQMAANVLGRGPTVVIVTLGAHGVLVHGTDLGTARIAAYVVAARDTTGAGDCFVGAYASARLRGLEVIEAARFANAAAALSVIRDGAAASYPRRRDVEALLGENGNSHHFSS